MKSIFLAAALVAAFFTSSAKAFDIPCFQGDGAEFFKNTHDEHILGKGIAGDGAVYIILLNPATKTWTIYVERPGPGKFFCPVASGIEFEIMAPPVIESKKGVET
tara:strand:+ start:809 stop:1123 length:315 start_codon:yes stop_codon:yes gene_type:complete